MVVCTSADCSNGLARVRGLRSMFDQLGQPPQFAPAVQALEDEAATLEASAGWFRAFDSDCCALSAVGDRAALLTGELARASGVAAPPNPQAESQVDKVLLVVGVGVVALLVFSSAQLAKVVKS